MNTLPQKTKIIAVLIFFISFIQSFNKRSTYDYCSKILKNDAFKEICLQIECNLVNECFSFKCAEVNHLFLHIQYPNNSIKL